jgi:hypothetical protein
VTGRGQGKGRERVFSSESRERAKIEQREAREMVGEEGKSA